MILVTGGTGLVGSHLIKTLIQQNKIVKALYRFAIPQFDEAKKVEWIKGDILDPISLENALQNVQQVYHCAGLVSFHPKNKKELFQINVEGTANVVNASVNANVKKLLFVSSASALEKNRKKETINESMNWSQKTNNSEYGKSKYLAEMEVWRGIGEGLNAVIINPVIILGAYNWNKGSSAIFKSVYNEFPWYTEGVNGFVDVQDVVNAMIILMESEITGQRFIISAESISYKNLFDKIALSFSKNPPHKKVNHTLAEIIWRIEAVKSKLTNKKTLLTKETAQTAQNKFFFDNTKLLKAFPSFSYTPLQQSVNRICKELKQKYNLK
ncbi:MAG: NAD-dependent epimerase/dehydratase family protein [Chitinophagaceae bacterium]